jgi:hypothetical protein
MPGTGPSPDIRFPIVGVQRIGLPEELRHPADHRGG